MADRPFCFLIATALLAVGQLNGEAQVPRGGNFNAPRAEAVSPTPPGTGASIIGPGGAPMTAGGTDRPSTLIDPNRRLQQGDQLSFQITQDKEPPIPLVVSHTGELVVEPLERPVKVAGMTTTQAASEIKRLLERDYYHTATVRLALVAVNQTATMGYVYLDGAIAKIGALAVYAERPIKLSEAILMAGGFTKYADDRKVRVTRMRNGATEKLVCDMKQVMQKGDLERDLLLQDQDRIFVPTRFFQN
jgi:protein involved in polysaccharide export with SLBB domain